MTGLEMSPQQSQHRLPYAAKELVVAGGGIGGLTAALALNLSGFDVAVYERAPAFS
jgi:heterodisulfide reductase subunit A-like polyferredoxin